MLPPAGDGAVAAAGAACYIPRAMTDSQASAPKTGAPGEAPRRAAFDVLRQVLRRGSDLEGAIAHSPRWQQLGARDKAFARQLAATVLRRLGQIDAAISACLDKPLKAKLGAVQDLLRLGTAQVLFMEVATHAAVGETVALAVGVFIVSAIFQAIPNSNTLGGAQDQVESLTGEAFQIAPVVLIVIVAVLILQFVRDL